MKIKFDDFQDVNAFTTGIQFFDGDIDMIQGRLVGNARSFLQVCSMDLSQPMEAKINTDDYFAEEDFYNFIKKWEVKE